MTTSVNWWENMVDDPPTTAAGTQPGQPGQDGQAASSTHSAQPEHPGQPAVVESRWDVPHTEQAYATHTYSPHSASPQAYAEPPDAIQLYPGQSYAEPVYADAGYAEKPYAPSDYAETAYALPPEQSGPVATVSHISAAPGAAQREVGDSLYSQPHPLETPAPVPVPTPETPPVPVAEQFDYAVVMQLRAQVASRLAKEEKTYRDLAPEARRELARTLVRDEVELWLQTEVQRGKAALDAAGEDRLISAVLAELEGLGRLAPLLERTDIEDIHFEGTNPTMLRLSDGQFVQGPVIADSDASLVQMLQALGARYGDGQTSREFSTANPILNVRLRGMGNLGARLAAEMDVVPRPMGCIRMHQHVDIGLDNLHQMRMVDSSMRAFLRAAVVAGASICVTGSPGVGKTTLLRALVNEIPWNNVVVTVEDERELGTHLFNRHAVVKSYEQRMPNADGVGAFTMGDALNQALRDSPTRIVVGEVRGAYIIHLLDAVTNGIAGALCTLHAPTARGMFERVLINAQKAHPAPTTELVMRSLSTLDLVVHVTRDAAHNRFVSEVLELGPVSDSGYPSATHIFAPSTTPGLNGRGVGVAGSLSRDLAGRLAEAGFDEGWLRPENSDWEVSA